MLTVLLATRNGAKTLPSVLDSFSRLDVPESGWKLIVVDNGSTDNTRDILKSFGKKLPLTFLYETAPGKNAALNTGLAQVEGDLVILTDDDVYPRRDWLLKMRAAVDAHPEIDVFGGTILPRWESPPPAWIAWTELSPTFAVTAPELAEGQVSASNIYGPNMAVRADIFLRDVRFDAAIGPRGTSYAMGSETELVRRLLSQGRKAWHVKDAVVEHFIRSTQLSPSWVMGRAVRFGRGQYRLEYGPTQGEATSHWFGAPRYLYKAFISQALSIASAALRMNRQALFRARWQWNFLKGQFIEARIFSRDKLSGEARRSAD